MTLCARLQETLIYAEAKSSGDVVRRCLRENYAPHAELGRHLRQNPPPFVVTNGRGTSDHAGVFAKYELANRLGIIVASGAPSIASIYGQPLKAKSAMMLSISQSGKSPDIVEAVRSFRAAEGYCVTLTNSDHSPLERESHVTLRMHAGPERSVAATKSYISSLASILAIIAHWSEDYSLFDDLAILPDLLEEAWEQDWAPLIDGVEGVNALYTIGRGSGLAIAREAALKFKETCQIHAEAFSGAECSHGPLALIRPGFPLLVFSQNDAAQPGLQNLTQKAIALGAPVFCAGADIPGTVSLPVVKAPVSLQPILMIQSFYRAVGVIALRRGIDPDNPPSLRKITETV